MDYFKEKYSAGEIDFKTYDKMMEILDHLEKNNYRYNENIGEGTYGSVIKVSHTKTDEEMAAKITDINYTSDGELYLWKTLNHTNILQLIDVKLAYYADSYVFYTPVYPTNLEQKISESSFMSSEKALIQAATWLKEILDAVAYLHSKNLSHNDIKCNNILISNQDRAVLADFGFLTETEKPIQIYGAPVIYRCPEGRKTETGLTPINGKELDIWTMGMLAFEMFTNTSLLRELSKQNRRLSSWISDVYPVLQNSLQDTNFVKLMQEAFPSSENIDEISNNAMNFITSCLNVVPGKRPDARQLQKHKLFGGAWENVELENEVNIWKTRVNVHDFDDILQQNEFEKPSEHVTVESDKSQRNGTYTLHNGAETFMDADPVVLQQSILGENASNNEEHPLARSINEKNLVLDVNDKFVENSHCSLTTAKESNSDVPQNLMKRNQFLSAASNHHKSLNISDSQKERNSESELIIETKLVPLSASSAIISRHSSAHKNSITVDELEIKEDPEPIIPEVITRRLKFRMWWKRQKFAIVRIVTSCLPRAKKNAREILRERTTYRPNNY